MKLNRRESRDAENRRRYVAYAEARPRDGRTSAPVYSARLRGRDVRLTKMLARFAAARVIALKGVPRSS